MSNGRRFEGTLAASPARGSAREAEEFYFRIHLLLILLAVLCYLTAIGWMIWRMVCGGPFEFAIVPVVSCVLLAVMLASVRSMWIIAWDGRPKKQKVELIPARSKRVSVEQWTIRTPGKPAKPVE